MRVPRPDGEATYFHSLLGTSLVLNGDAEALLDTFRSPARITRRNRVLDAFVERRLLVDATADERAEFVAAMRPERPETGAHLQGLLLLAAEQCNLACPYCIKDKLMDLRRERPQARVTMETARRAIDAFLEVAERGPHRDLGLQFRGGEALLNAEVVLDATRYMRARWTRGGVVVSMVSNATLVTDALARALAELGVMVEVSLDGPRAIHDLIRITHAGRPTHDRVVAGLARLVAAGVEVTNVNTTVTAETLPLIDAAFFVELRRLGVRHVNLEPDVLRPALPDPRELATRVLQLRALANAQGLELLGCWGRAVRAVASVREGAALPPPADYALLIVDALGHVVPWEYNGVAELGPVTDLPRVLASDTYQRHVETRSPGTIPECVGCEVEGLCQGNASTVLVYERATGRTGLFAHRCELVRALTRGVLAEALALDPPRRRRTRVPRASRACRRVAIA